MIIASDAVVGNTVYLRYSSMDVLNRALHRLKHLGRKHLLTGHMGVPNFEEAFHRRNLETIVARRLELH
jgi:hypothetical protein